MTQRPSALSSLNAWSLIKDAIGAAAYILLRRSRCDAVENERAAPATRRRAIILTKLSSVRTPVLPTIPNAVAASRRRRGFAVVASSPRRRRSVAADRRCRVSVADRRSSLESARFVDNPRRVPQRRCRRVAAAAFAAAAFAAAAFAAAASPPPRLPPRRRRRRAAAAAFAAATSPPRHLRGPSQAASPPRMLWRRRGPSPARGRPTDRSRVRKPTAAVHPRPTAAASAHGRSLRRTRGVPRRRRDLPRPRLAEGCLAAEAAAPPAYNGAQGRCPRAFGKRLGGKRSQAAQFRRSVSETGFPHSADGIQGKTAGVTPLPRWTAFVVASLS